MSRWTVGIGIPVLLLLFAGISLAQAPSGQNTADSLAQAAAMLDRIESREEDQETVDTLAEQVSEIVNKVLDEDRANSYANYLKGRMELLSGLPADARPRIEEYSKYEGRNDPLPFKLLGDIHMMGGYFKLAYPQYQKAAELNPTDPEIFTDIAICEAYMQKYEKSEASIAKARKLQKGANSLELNKAIADIVKIKIRYYEKAGWPNDPSIFLDTFREGDQAESTAIQQTIEKIENDPDNLTLLNELMMMYQYRIEMQNRFKLLTPGAGPYIEQADLVAKQAVVSLLVSRHQALMLLQDGIDNEDLSPDDKQKLKKLMNKYAREITQVEGLLGVHPNPDKRRSWEPEPQPETPAEAEPAKPAAEEGAASQS